MKIIQLIQIDDTLIFKPIFYFIFWAILQINKNKQKFFTLNVQV